MKFSLKHYFYDIIIDFTYYHSLSPFSLFVGLFYVFMLKRLSGGNFKLCQRNPPPTYSRVKSLQAIILQVMSEVLLGSGPGTLHIGKYKLDVLIEVITFYKKKKW